MSERRLQSKYVPLRIRLRPSADQVQQNDQGHAPPETITTPIPIETNNSVANQVQLPTSTGDSAYFAAQRRAWQIKEWLHLGTLLRADLGLEEVLQQIADSIATCTGFRRVVINLIDEKKNCVSRVAFAGLTPEDETYLREALEPRDRAVRLMRPEFRVSQSYFLPHEHAEKFKIGSWLPGKVDEEYQPGDWHTDDCLLVPLFSPREQKMLGYLSLDDPEDRKVPTEESIEVAELFANQAAIALDNVRFFEEREAEHQALEQGIILLKEDMERLQSGDLRTHIRSTHPKLQPLAEAINAMVEVISSILGSMQKVTRAVDEHTRSVQRSSESLVRDTSQQERQVHQISQVIQDIAALMHTVSENAALLSKTAVEAVDVTTEAQGAVDRAVDGMGMVREATMQSSRTMKALSESGQEISETVLAITDLTIRMHHLALNAAIEATRAGEHGHGFAVIAQEIRALATHSSEAARKVGTYIRTIQHETTAVSQSVEQSTQHVVMQTELVTQTGVALDAVEVITEQLSYLIEEICSTAESQQQGKQLVVNAVEEILRVTDDITRNMREMQQSLDHLVDLSDSLRSRMAIFNIRPS